MPVRAVFLVSLVQIFMEACDSSTEDLLVFSLVRGEQVQLGSREHVSIITCRHNRSSFMDRVDDGNHCAVSIADEGFGKKWKIIISFDGWLRKKNLKKRDSGPSVRKIRVYKKISANKRKSKGVE